MESKMCLSSVFISVLPPLVSFADLAKPNLVKLLKPTDFMSLSFLSSLVTQAGRSLKFALKGVK